MHDCADGGLLVTVAEMALSGGADSNGTAGGAGMGVELFPYEGKLPSHAAWFGEDQGRYVVAVTPEQAEETLERARLLALPARIVGRVGGDALSMRGEAVLKLTELRAAHEGWMKEYMGG